jgi:hypothetical protein
MPREIQKICFYCGKNRNIQHTRKTYIDNKIVAYSCFDNQQCINITTKHHQIN